MKDAEEMWRIVHESFEYHRKSTDPDAQSALERVAMKCLRLNERRTFNRENCSISEKTFTPESLQSLVVYHNRDQPVKMEGPIVVLNYDGRSYVIEGNTRTNAWRAGKYGGPFTAIVLDPQDHAA